MGPNLNVIIGPNGSGKSTLVNGICIGLAGKASILGRASKVGDFVQERKDEASIETELYNDRGENIIVYRKFNRAGKSEWRLNGKKTTEKDVRERVAKYRIQVDNLCQFLPQDKVHDFSRLNNKDLLDSTIDAVGDTGLKEKHSELKTLQKEFDEGDNIYAQKEKVFQEKKEKCDKMEDDVKIFKQKRELMKKQEMLAKRRIWELFYRKKKECKETISTESKQKEVVDKAERSLGPLKKEIEEIKTRITKITKVKGTIASSEKEYADKAKIHSRNIENSKNKLIELEDDETTRLRKMKEREKNKEKYESDIRVLERENRDENFEEVEAKIAEAKRNTIQTSERLVAEKDNIEHKRYDIQSQERELNSVKSELSKLNDIDERKMNTLKGVNKEVWQAVNWLRNNKENFKGQVFEPFLICANVPKAENAIYLENSINNRDMQIFFFTYEEDMNRFLKTVRVDMRLERVGAAMLPRQSLDYYTPRVPGESLTKYGFVSYLKDMVVAPDPVLAYMCQNYHLHNTAVFHPNAEKYNSLILDLGITTYFFGHKRQAANRSAYSGKISTRTTQVKRHNLLGQSADQSRIAELHTSADNIVAEIKGFKLELDSLQLNIKHLKEELEKRRTEERELEQIRLNYNKNAKRIARLRAQIREAEDSQDDETEKERIKSAKHEIIMSMVKSGGFLRTTIEKAVKTSLDTEARCIEYSPLQELLDNKIIQLNSKEEGMVEMRKELTSLSAARKQIEATVIEALRAARKETGNNPIKKDQPPDSYLDYWKKENFPDGLALIDQMIGDFDAQIQCAGDVDQSVVDKYRDLKEQVTELEKEILNRDKTKKKQMRKIQEVRDAWLSSLNNLVREIDSRYGKLLHHMKFAGKVAVHTGKHENDFDNYGMKILVKYRDNDDYQELDPHRQSGGERSVATAIYMLALQTLTTVPFRCVDEINQGMDPINERLVFDLLVETSCNESNAQYFLLTPKLLPDLNYNPRMNVLVVHNGPHLPHHSEWRVEDITSFPVAGGA